MNADWADVNRQLDQGIDPSDLHNMGKAMKCPARSLKTGDHFIYDARIFQVVAPTVLLHEEAIVSAVRVGREDVETVHFPSTDPVVYRILDDSKGGGSK